MSPEKSKQKKRKLRSEVSTANAAPAEVQAPVSKADQPVEKAKRSKQRKGQRDVASLPQEPSSRAEEGQLAASSGGALSGKGKKRKAKRRKEAGDTAAAPDTAVAAAAESTAAGMTASAPVQTAAVADMPTKKKRKQDTAQANTEVQAKQVAIKVSKKSRRTDDKSAAPTAPTVAKTELPPGNGKKSKKHKPVAQSSTHLAQAQAQVELPGANSVPEASPIKVKKKRKAKQQQYEQEGIIMPAADLAGTEVGPQNTELVAKPGPVLNTVKPPEANVQVAANGHEASRPSSMGGSGSGGRSFQRVNAEEWLGQKGSWDNSYNATFGNEGWGAKAQERLSQVRGKDFRHEKTKKKRGAYRGGAIDGGVRSFKYESDNE